jgi:hypothetical protein
MRIIRLLFFLHSLFWGGLYLGLNSGQVLYYLSPFCTGYFVDGSVWLFAQLAWTLILMFSIWGYGLAYPAFLGWDGVSQTFAGAGLWTTMLWISASQVARITGMSHLCWLPFLTCVLLTSHFLPSPSIYHISREIRSQLWGSKHILEVSYQRSPSQLRWSHSKATSGQKNREENYKDNLS